MLNGSKSVTALSGADDSAALFRCGAVSFDLVEVSLSAVAVFLRPVLCFLRPNVGIPGTTGPDLFSATVGSTFGAIGIKRPIGFGPVYFLGPFGPLLCPIGLSPV